jgi:hypothetical protein
MSAAAGAANASKKILTVIKFCRIAQFPEIKSNASQKMRQKKLAIKE